MLHNAKTFVIEGRTIRSLDDFYRAVREELNFPEYFGENLDALWDCLVNDTKGPIRVIWMNSRVSEEAVGTSFQSLRELLLKDLPAKRSDVEFVLE